jgi:hypothetical protein
MKIHATVTLTVTELWMKPIRPFFLRISAEPKTEIPVRPVRRKCGVVTRLDGSLLS